MAAAEVVLTCVETMSKGLRPTYNAMLSAPGHIDTVMAESRFQFATLTARSTATALLGTAITYSNNMISVLCDSLIVVSHMFCKVTCCCLLPAAAATATGPVHIQVQLPCFIEACSL